MTRNWRKKRIKRGHQRLGNPEPLEVRQLMAADVFVDSGVLHVHGTSGNDEITVESRSVDDLEMIVTTIKDTDTGKVLARSTSGANIAQVRVTGLAGNDIIRNHTALDSYIRAGAGNDVVVGGSARDMVFAGPGDDSVNAGDGDDHIHGGDGRDVLYGGNGNDHLTGAGNQDRLYGGRGDDYLHGGDHPDRVWGGDGDDEIYTGAAYGIVFGGDGDDTIVAENGSNQLHGEAGDDIIHGGVHNDMIDGGEGEDRLHGAAGDDRIYGGDGNDQLFGGAGNDVMAGGDGHDLLFGGEAQDSMRGEGGIDLVTGVPGIDTIEADIALVALAGGVDSDNASVVVKESGIDEHQLGEAITAVFGRADFDHFGDLQAWMQSRNETEDAIANASGPYELDLPRTGQVGIDQAANSPFRVFEQIRGSAVSWSNFSVPDRGQVSDDPDGKELHVEIGPVELESQDSYDVTVGPVELESRDSYDVAVGPVELESPGSYEVTVGPVEQLYEEVYINETLPDTPMMDALKWGSGTVAAVGTISWLYPPWGLV